MYNDRMFQAFSHCETCDQIVHLLGYICDTWEIDSVNPSSTEGACYTRMGSISIGDSVSLSHACDIMNISLILLPS